MTIGVRHSAQLPLPNFDSTLMLQIHYLEGTCKEVIARGLRATSGKL